MLFPTEKSVKEFMFTNDLHKLKLYVTAYVNHSNQQCWGFTKENVNSDYYKQQKTITTKTKVFTL
jgi:3D (Asp-Asp-Asp) domain-containing protein